MKIHIIGTGLIGGSFALGIKAAFSDVEVVGSDASRSAMVRAKELGVVDQFAEIDQVKDADVVIISVPVDAAPALVGQVLDSISGETLVFDAGSTKSGVCKAVGNHPKRRNFLASHPIAGTEFSGPEAAFPGLFNGKTTIVCEIEKTAPKLQELAIRIFKGLNMHIRYMDPESHDRHIAYVSHLSHISSFMLGKTVLEKEKNERDIFDLAGSGFASTVRLAKSSPAMWAPIFRQNKENVLESLTGYIQNLNDFKELLEKDDFQEIFGEMARTNHIKTVLKGIE